MPCGCAPAVDDLAQQLQQVGNVNVGLKIGDRPSDIGIDEIQHRRYGLGETPDLQVFSDHDQGDIDAGQHVRQIRVRFGQRDITGLQLIIHRIQFFVG